MTEENTAPTTEKTPQADAPEAPTPAAMDEKPANDAPASAEATPDKPAQNDKTQGGKKDDQNDRRNPAQRGRGGGGRGRRDRKPREPKEFEESIIQIDRVTRVTKGGRQLRFRVSVVIGDQKGRVGFGIGKSAEVMSGVQKAIASAKQNLVTVPIFEDTIPHAVSHKFKASKVFLLPAPEGKGVIAGGAVRKVLELAGIKNVLSKMHGSRNKLNSVYATMECLKALQNRAPIAVKDEAVNEASTEEASASAKATADKPAKDEKSPATADKKAEKKKPSASAKAAADKPAKKTKKADSKL